jgi:hypothetical protein
MTARGYRARAMVSGSLEAARADTRPSLTSPNAEKGRPPSQGGIEPTRRWTLFSISPLGTVGQANGGHRAVAHCLIYAPPLLVFRP